MSPVIQIRLLGGFEVLIDGQRVPSVDWQRRQAAALVKCLALAAGRTLHREQVIDTLWPELSVGQAAPRLHKAAHYARRAMRRPRSLVLSGETVALFPDTELDVDATRFQRLAESAKDTTTAGIAADAYPGDLLPHDCYEAWTEEPRERLRLLYLRMLRRAGRWYDILGAEPTDESAHLGLVRHMTADGDIRLAQSQFERLERGLRELGVGPTPEAVRLGHELHRGRAEVVVVAPDAGPVLEALAELCRNHPALRVRQAPIAVIIV